MIRRFMTGSRSPAAMRVIFCCQQSTAGLPGYRRKCCHSRGWRRKGGTHHLPHFQRMGRSTTSFGQTHWSSPKFYGFRRGQQDEETFEFILRVLGAVHSALWLERCQYSIGTAPLRRLGNRKDGSGQTTAPLRRLGNRKDGGGQSTAPLRRLGNRKDGGSQSTAPLRRRGNRTDGGGHSTAPLRRVGLTVQVKAHLPDSSAAQGSFVTPGR